MLAVAVLAVAVALASAASASPSASAVAQAHQQRVDAILAGAPPPVQRGDAAAFAAFAARFGKQYASAAARAEAFGAWRLSRAAAAALNDRAAALNSTARFGETALADLTPAQFAAKMRSPLPMAPRSRGLGAGNGAEAKKAVLPPGSAKAMDWQARGAVTPVKNQEQCGSCWAFSATEEIESANILADPKKFSNTTLKLAPQQIVDCDDTSDGCGGGHTESAYNYVKNAGGLEPSKDYPYTAQNGQCTAKKSEFVATLKSFSYATSGSNSDEQNMVTAMQTTPISICIDAKYWQHYTGGVMTADECAWIVQLDHCVQATGYNTASGSSPYWVVRNSWGTAWGLQGYIHLEMWKNTCGITDDATIVQA